MSKLHKDTPLAKAVFSFIQELSEIAEETHGDLPKGSIRAFIFGGCAVHIYTNVRGSADLDVELDAAKELKVNELILDLEDWLYETDDGTKQVLTWDNTFNPAIPDLHPDWKESSIPLHVGDEVIHIYLVSAVDVAVSKLGRCTSDDVNDIISLYKSGRFTKNEFKERCEEALKYTPTYPRLKSNVDYAISVLDEINDKV
ncbi:DUF6036 family nucleotidyltransferase [Vibrio crassostreae]|uniref:DUF6036 family nucleotidyltransferase n=1 Tax=Vibrio crassostreae TaxID=246167 RepID=UPI001B307E0E|nr:DUF6036 family nucleotidyltransferase [Vibrio crassostreae]